MESDRTAKLREQSLEARKPLFLKEENLMQPVRMQRKDDGRRLCSIFLSVQKEIELRSVVLD